MPQVAEIDWHVTGDIGGTGVSRFRFTRLDLAIITQADCNAAAAAQKKIFTAMVPYTPNSVGWACMAQVNIYDVTTGQVALPQVISTLPTSIVGTGGTTFAAGTGGRVNWKTAQVAGRRLLRGSWYMVPFANAAYNASGGVLSSVTATLNTALATYLTDMATAALAPVVWHRPPKGTHTGGIVGQIFVGAVSPVPAGLRSRRS